jgi:hypothetical protein
MRLKRSADKQVDDAIDQPVHPAETEYYNGEDQQSRPGNRRFRFRRNNASSSPRSTAETEAKATRAPYHVSNKNFFTTFPPLLNFTHQVLHCLTPPEESCLLPLSLFQHYSKSAADAPRVL